MQFPDHPQERFRRQCGNLLMKTIVSNDGKKTYLYPYKVYCYRKIRDSIEELLKRKDFLEMLLKGPDASSEECFGDIVDGIICKTFTDSEGKLFFTEKRNLGGMINLDWFNPYENQEYSVAVMYMALVNLPRAVRFKWENVVVLGIIPGPKEPNYNVNWFLEPHIDELK